MPRVRVGRRSFDVEAILFDKDGTLVDLDAYWGPPAGRWIEVASGGDPALAGFLAQELGFDRATGTVLPGRPFAGMTLRELGELTTGLLLSRGIPSSEARARAERAREAASAAARRARVVPIGDVAGAFRRLRRAGLALGVATSDDHEAAERALLALGVRDLVALVVGGDDGAPAKPDPGLVEWAAARLGTRSGRLLVVGDTDLDRRMAVRAAGFVAVVRAGRPAPPTDPVVGSIDELVVEPA